MLKGKRWIAFLTIVVFTAALSYFAREKNGAARQEAWSSHTLADAGYEDEAPYKGKVALTFDDGPHPVYTPQLLDGLKKRDVKVTFFVTGENVESYPEIVKRASEEGHLIGNHTFHHVQLTAANSDDFKKEIISTNDIIQEVTGKETSFIRPPYGSWDKKYEKELNMFPVLWDVDPLDWCSTNVDKIVRSVLAGTKENSIILMHDSYDSTVTAALQVVDILKAEGYEFVTVDEILFD
ncbi:polysaccharide deacetylase family protein [Eisenbergiella porci]|uniref:polysaccharide deacetylase family protein n=1 Tax=Eisenbergiella porci TaxID=2652274 RepID=UPI002A81927E|nr:polysaccharide deacetylase family protein [Eisenbergiella porci]